MNNIIKATHDGTLPIGDITLDVAVLGTGQRIINQASIFTALRRPQRGNSRQIDVPVFMDASNLQPFVGEDLKSKINKVTYLSKTGKTVEGYDATILPLVCDLYLKAREAGVIARANQQATAQQAEIVVRSLAKVGIIALIDEATGYQEDRDKTALREFLEKFLTEEKGKWIKTFPDEFFESIFKMKGWDWNSAVKGQKPGVVGKYINNYVWARIAPGVLTELRRINPNVNGKRKGKNPQFIDVDFGHPKLKEHLRILTLYAKAAGYNWNNWERMINRTLPKYEDDGSQIQELDFEDI